MKEAYVSFETAKLLKGKGFDEECNNYYDQSSDEPQQLTLDEMYYSYDEFVKAPTHQMACAWLREIHNIDIEIRRSPNTMMYRCIVYKDTLVKCITDAIIETYEEAVEAALKYSLENLV